jgi:hypothetical protein
MPKQPALRFRQVHLDFHTSIHIPDVGRDFNADRFAKTFADAHVDSVTVFAKCHHGLLYYETDHPARHPGLKDGLDLTRQQVDALHARDIRAPIYISVQCDEYAADMYPEWVVLRSTGQRHAPGQFERPKFRWQILDMSSPYQEYLADQVSDVLRQFDPVDGIFFDMCWDQKSSSKWAIDGMKRLGLNPADDTDQGKYAHKVALDYMKRFYKQVKQSNPNATVYFNSRPLFNLPEEIPYLSQVEIEALPTGGWGYMYFPKNVRYTRRLDRPFLGMTARFHKSWADFGGLKPYPALEYETSQMIAHGARCSIGDQLHPRGTLDRAAYDLIGKVYKRVADREPWLVDATPVTQLAVLQTETGAGKEESGTAEGVVRLLQQLRHQFDVIAPSAKLKQYDLLILPDLPAVDAALGKKIDAFVKAGGAVLATGLGGLSADGKASHVASLPIKPLGLHDFETTYLRFGNEIADDVPPTDHVAYERPTKVAPAGRAKTIAQIVDPYFDRTWEHFSSHAQTPPAKLSNSPAAVLSGRVAYIAYPLFGLHARHGNQHWRLLLRNVLRHLLPTPLLEVAGPSGIETSVMRQPKSANRPARTILHLLYYPCERRASNLDLIEDIVPVHNLPIKLRLASKPKRVYLAPEGTDLPFTHTKPGTIDLTLPTLAGHAMIVLET